LNRPFRLRPPSPSENDVEAGCLQLLRLRGWYPVRLHAGTFKTVDGLRWIKGVDKGTPDYIAVHETFPGFFMEVKRPGKKPEPLQVAKITELRGVRRLHVTVVGSPEELQHWLNHHERRLTAKA
jgi:hypothetical protein